MDKIILGFIKALIVAVVSFLVIFFIFPGFSDKYYGISNKSNETSVKELKEEISENTAEVRKTFSDGKEEFKKAVDDSKLKNIKDKFENNVSDISVKKTKIL